MVVAPTSFRPGIPLSIGVNILNSSAPVIVTASLAVPQSVDIQQIPGAVASGEFHQGIVRPANRDWACQSERCHTLSNKTSLH